MATTKLSELLSSIDLKTKIMVALIPVAFGAIGGMSSEKFRHGQQEGIVNTEIVNMKGDIKELDEDKADKTDIVYIKEALRSIQESQIRIEGKLDNHIDK